MLSQVLGENLQYLLFSFLSQFNLLLVSLLVNLLYSYPSIIIGVLVVSLCFLSEICIASRLNLNVTSFYFCHYSLIPEALYQNISTCWNIFNVFFIL